MCLPESLQDQGKLEHVLLCCYWWSKEKQGGKKTEEFFSEENEQLLAITLGWEKPQKKETEMKPFN